MCNIEMDGPNFLVLSGPLGADSLHIGEERPHDGCCPNWRRKKPVELGILKKKVFLSLLGYIWTSELEFDFCLFFFKVFRQLMDFKKLASEMSLT